MAIPWGRMKYLKEVMNAQAALLIACSICIALLTGSPKKLVVEPHNMTKKITPVEAGAHG
jgi:hypothetical protein